MNDKIKTWVLFLFLTFPLALLSFFKEANGFFISQLSSFIMLFPLTIISFSKIRKRDCTTKYLIILLFISGSNLIYFGQTNLYGRYLIFFVYVEMLLTLQIYKTLNFKMVQVVVKYVYYFVLFYATYIYFIDYISGEYLMPNYRFSGFSISPTTFSAYMCMLTVIYYYLSDRVIFVYLFLSFVLIFLSETRTNILLYPISIYLVYLSKKGLLINKNFFFYAMLLGVILFYPLVMVFIENQYISDLLNNRVNSSASNITRFNMYFTQLYYLKLNGIKDYIIGNGIGATDKIFSDLETVLKAHNDFFLLLYDFGVIYLVIFITVLRKFALRSNLFFILILNYLFAFYHNMIFNLPMIALLILGNIIVPASHQIKHRTRDDQ